MAIWQNGINEGNRMVKLAPTPEGMPSVGQGSGVLSGWRLNQPILPSGTGITFSSASGWVNQSAQVIVQDVCGNISPTITIPASIIIFPATAPNMTDGCDVQFSSMPVTMHEQPFIGDEWLYGYTNSNNFQQTVPATAVDGLNMPNLLSINPGTYYGVNNFPGNGVYVDRTSAISDGAVRYGNELQLAPGTLGPGVVSVPPSWQSGPSNVTFGITHTGIMAPLSQTTSTPYTVTFAASAPAPSEPGPPGPGSGIHGHRHVQPAVPPPSPPPEPTYDQPRLVGDPERSAVRY